MVERLRQILADAIANGATDEQQQRIRDAIASAERADAERERRNTASTQNLKQMLQDQAAMGETFAQGYVEQRRRMMAVEAEHLQNLEELAARGVAGAEEMAAAQAELAQATLAEQQAGSYAQNLQDQVASEYVEPQQENISQPDPEMDAWSKRNPWFMGSEPIHKEMTSFAMYVDQSLQANGVDPQKNSQQYYSEVDAKMREQFPNFFGVSQQQPAEAEEVVETPRRQVVNPVAPATRNSSKTPRKIHLTQSQVALAKRLNITPEQYANQLLKEN